MSNISRQLGEGFILTVGITPPKPGCERIANRYITGMIALSIAAAAGMFALILSQVR